MPPFVTVEGSCEFVDEPFKQRMVLVKDEHSVIQPAPFSCNQVNCLCSDYVVEVGERFEDYEVRI